MTPIHTTLLAGMAATLLGAAQPALATVHVFQLTGHAAAGTYVQAGNAYSAVVALSDDSTASGLLPGRTVATGDTLNATILFDRALQVPASAANPQPYAAYFGFDLGWFDPARVEGGTTVYATVGVRFFDAGTEVFAGPALLPDSGCGNILCVGSVAVPATQAMHFDRVDMTAHIDGLFLNTPDLGQVYTVESPGQFSVYVQTPVPEPASAALLLGGLLAGVAPRLWLRRRRQPGAAALPGSAQQPT